MVIEREGEGREREYHQSFMLGISVSLAVSEADFSFSAFSLFIEFLREREECFYHLLLSDCRLLLFIDFFVVELSFFLLKRHHNFSEVSM